MTKYALDRVRRGLPMPDVVEVPKHVPVCQAFDDLVLIMEASHAAEWSGQVVFLPLR